MGDGAVCTKCTDTRLTCRSCFDFHMKALADRIAKLEAAVDGLLEVSDAMKQAFDNLRKMDAWRESFRLPLCPFGSRCRGDACSHGRADAPQPAKPPAAATDALESVERNAAAGPAEQPANAADELAAACKRETVLMARAMSTVALGARIEPIEPPAPAPRVEMRVAAEHADEYLAQRLREATPFGAEAIERVLETPPAPAQGAPAEPLKPWPTNRLAWCCWCDRRDIPSATAKDHWQQCEEHPANERIAALEARLAAAETEKAMLSAHCVRAERIAQERKDKLAAAEQSRAVLEKVVEHHRGLADKVIAAERERDETACELQTYLVREDKLMRERDEARRDAVGRTARESWQRAEKDLVDARREIGVLQGALNTAHVAKDAAVAAERERWQKFHDEEKERWRAGLQRANEAAENRVANVISDCLRIVEAYEPRRDVPADWSYQGALSRVAEAIRDGRPAPK